MFDIRKRFCHLQNITQPTNMAVLDDLSGFEFEDVM